jgi:hypothetical protein
MSVWTITIYGSDTLLGTLDVLKSDVVALSDVVVMATGILGADPSIEQETEPYTSLSGTMYSSRHARVHFKLKLDPIAFPATATTIQTLYHSDLYSKKYHYIWWNDYPLVDSSLTVATECLAVAISKPEIDPDYNSGTKNISIPCSKMVRE